MAIVPEVPKTKLSNKQIEAFHRDGVICVRQLYSDYWLGEVERALDEITAAPSLTYGGKVEIGDSRFRVDAFTWGSDDRVRDFVLLGPTAHIARQVFGGGRVNFFYDQIFVKEASAPQPTPWHHDYTFWPMVGDQIVSVWMSVDPTSPETSALEFIAGSHLWPQRFEAVAANGQVVSQRPLDPVPDIEADREKFDILSWSLEPGDALLFHALTLHGSRGNASKAVRRRAITTRWCGEDVRYCPIEKQMPMPFATGLESGAPLSGPVFPQVLPHLLDEEIGERMRGPLTLEAATVEANRARMVRVD